MSEWLSLTAYFSDSRQWNPCNPYKSCNHELYIVFIFPHIGCHQEISHYLSQYCPRSMSPYGVTMSTMSEMCALWCCPMCGTGYVIILSYFMQHIYPCILGLLHWHWSNHMIAPVSVEQPRRIYVNMIDTKTQQSITKHTPYTYFLAHPAVSCDLTS